MNSHTTRTELFLVIAALTIVTICLATLAAIFLSGLIGTWGMPIGALVGIAGGLWIASYTFDTLRGNF